MKIIFYMLLLVCVMVSCKQMVSKLGVEVVDSDEGARMKDGSSDVSVKLPKTAIKDVMNENITLKTIYETTCNRIGQDFADGLMAESVEGGIRVYSRDFPTTNAVIKENAVIAKAGSLVDAGPVNELLVDILPNKTYIVDDVFKYQTDNLSRVVYAECDRTKAYKMLGGKRNCQRNSDVQKRIVKSLDGRYDDSGKALDDGGHLFANNTGGPNELINQVPLDRELNRHGLWRECERIEEKALKAGKSLQSFRKNLYKGDCKRPYAVEFTYIIDGEKTTVIIPNE